ncbi:hypothetical protein IH992_25755 [Candidatus Poribacteria bacterium]|nr:hypothetical protein [Candidatus Poribacteria bacterium]
MRMVNPEGVQTEGMMIIDNEIVGFNEMFRRFINTPTELKNSIIIQSDRAVPHGQIVRVIDIALQAGIGKINFAPVARDD